MSFSILVRFAGMAAMIGVVLLMGGCAAAAGDAKRSAKMPWWVASPSAPLPRGFPAPAPPDEVVIKQYPAYRAARIAATPAMQTPNSMFYPLFNHIEKNHVAMSSPVEITYDPPASAAPQPAADAMAFLYGDPSTGAAGADGADGKVQVIDVPAMTVASVGVAGAYTKERFASAYARLSAWLEHHSEYVPAGNPRYLAYNSPFVLPFMRYGEVQIPLRQERVRSLTNP